MKYYIIAGEASGDLHGSNLIKQLHVQDTAADIRCWGGDLMQQAGATLVKHYRNLAFMGFAEVVKNLPTILQNIKLCKADIATYRPDVLILIDYPGFNLRIAKWAKQNGLRVIYYISPQVWAWKANRVVSMKQCIDVMLVILPFEKAYFADKWNWPVTYVGHPLVEVVDACLNEPLQPLPALLANPLPVIALLPGSRKQEIAKKLPIMLSVCAHFPQYQFAVAQAPGQAAEFYAPFLEQYQNVTLIQGKTYHLLRHSKAALVTSGTATLETALLGVPEVVCYKTSAISYSIGKRLVKIKFISLVNLIMNQLVVKELIQDALNTPNLVHALQELLDNSPQQQQLQNQYRQLKQLLSQDGTASEKAATLIVQQVKDWQHL